MLFRLRIRHFHLALNVKVRYRVVIQNVNTRANIKERQNVQSEYEPLIWSLYSYTCTRTHTQRKH